MRLFSSLLTVIVIAVVLTSLVAPRAEAESASSLNIVAHEDDDILFLNPDLYSDLTSGRRVRTVFLTAGDAGVAASHWKSREEGAKAAYAKMLGVPNSWAPQQVTVLGHPIAVRTLKARPTVSLAFLRLPDGSPGGSGYPTNGNESLQRLWTGSVARVRAVDGSTSYSRRELRNVLTAMMRELRPDVVRAQDYEGRYGDGDHSDHRTSAYFANAASKDFPRRHTLVGYIGYPISGLSSNLSAREALLKQEAFLAYSAYDWTCKSLAQCQNSWYFPWFSRQYKFAFAVWQYQRTRISSRPI